MSEEIFFRSIYDHIGVPILVVRVDASGDFVFDSLNPACEKATGLRNEEAAGKRPEAISGLSRASAAALRANLPALPGGQCCHHCREPFVDRGQGNLVGLPNWRRHEDASREDRPHYTVRSYTFRSWKGQVLPCGSRRRNIACWWSSPFFGIMIVQDGRLMYANEVITGKGGYSVEEFMPWDPGTVEGVDTSGWTAMPYGIAMLSRLSGWKGSRKEMSAASWPKTGRCTGLMCIPR